MSFIRALKRVQEGAQNITSSATHTVSESIHSALRTKKDFFDLRMAQIPLPSKNQSAEISIVPQEQEPDKLQSELEAERLKIMDLQQRIKKLVTSREKKEAEDFTANARSVSTPRRK